MILPLIPSSGGYVGTERTPRCFLSRTVTVALLTRVEVPGSHSVSETHTNFLLSFQFQLCAQDVLCVWVCVLIKIKIGETINVMLALTVRFKNFFTQLYRKLTKSNLTFLKRIYLGAEQCYSFPCSECRSKTKRRCTCVTRFPCSLPLSRHDYVQWVKVKRCYELLTYWAR